MIPDYFKNSILKYSFKTYTDTTGDTQKDGQPRTLTVPDYRSIDIKKVRALIELVPDSWYAYEKISNHTNIEKLSFDLYGSPNYWDILLIINGRMPLFEFPYDFDVIELIVDDMLNKYEKYVYKKKLPEKVKEQLRLRFNDQVSEDNERFRYIKYIQKERLFEFIQMGYERGVFKRV